MLLFVLAISKLRTTDDDITIPPKPIERSISENDSIFEEKLAQVNVILFKEIFEEWLPQANSTVYLKFEQYLIVKS